MNLKYLVLELGSRSEVETTFYPQEPIKDFIKAKKKEVVEKEFYYLNRKSWGFDLGIGEELSYLIIDTESSMLKEFGLWNKETGVDLWEDEDFERLVEMCYDFE